MNKNNEIRLRVSQEELLLIKVKASKLGLSISAYVRMKALEGGKDE